MTPKKDIGEITLTLTFFDDTSMSNCNTTSLEKSTISGSMDWIDDDLGDCEYLYILNPIEYRTNVRLTGIDSKLENKTLSKVLWQI